MSEYKSMAGQAGEILNRLRHHSAKDLAKEQAKLTGTSTGLIKITEGEFVHLLDIDEITILKQAALIVQKLSLKAEHAKEIKGRKEKNEAKVQKDYLLRLNRALNELLPDYNAESRAITAVIEELVVIMLSMNKHDIFVGFYNKAEVEQYIKRLVDRFIKTRDLYELANELTNEIRVCLREYFYKPRDTDLVAGIKTIIRAAANEGEELRLRYTSLMAYLTKELTIKSSENVERLKPKIPRK